MLGWFMANGPHGGALFAEGTSSLSLGKITQHFKWLPESGILVLAPHVQGEPVAARKVYKWRGT